MHEGGGAAVHDRHFGRVQLDDRVVDTQGGERREQVLDCLNRDRLARQPGLILDPAEMSDRRGNFESAKIAALKPDAVVGRRGLQRQGDLVAGMKTNSGAGDGASQCALSVHSLSRQSREPLPSSAKLLPDFCGRKRRR